MARSKKVREKESLLAYMRALRKEFAHTLKKKLIVRTMKIATHAEHHGEIWIISGGHYLIRLDASGDYYTKIEQLCHEWSHILDVDRNGIREVERDPHDEQRWGPIYAEVFNVKDRITEELHAKWHTENSDD